MTILELRPKTSGGTARTTSWVIQKSGPPEPLSYLSQGEPWLGNKKTPLKNTRFYALPLLGTPPFCQPWLGLLVGPVRRSAGEDTSIQVANSQHLHLLRDLVASQSLEFDKNQEAIPSTSPTRIELRILCCISF